MKKRILFVCKHNLFRSEVARRFFNKFNKNKKYFADSAGVIEWDNRLLKNDVGYQIEKRIVKDYGIKLKPRSKGLRAKILKETDILVVVADDVHPSIFKKEKSFNGRLIVWKTKDVKGSYKNKERIARNTIEFIERKIKSFLKTLK